MRMFSPTFGSKSNANSARSDAGSKQKKKSAFPMFGGFLSNANKKTKESRDVELCETGNRERALSDVFAEEEAKGQPEIIGQKKKQKGAKESDSRPHTSNAFAYVPQPLTSKQLN